MRRVRRYGLAAQDQDQQRPSLGRFAQNPDAHEATAEYGEQIVETQIAQIGKLADQAGLGAPDLPTLTFDDVEPAWAAVERQRPSWVSYGPISSQPQVR